MSYAFRYNNYKHPNLVAAFDFGTLTEDKTKIKNLSLKGSTYDATIHGTYTPALPLIRNKKTPSMDFGGVNEYLSLANPISGLTRWSAVFVVNVDIVGRIVYCRATVDSLFTYADAVDGTIRTYLGGYIPFKFHTPFTDTYFVVQTYDSQTVNVWVNGRVQSFGASGVPTPVEPNLFIGQYFDGSLRLNGRLDNMLFYNVALTPDQVQSIWRSSIPR